MYNIDLYTYWKKPFTSGKNFGIHPLDEEGKETYYSDKSHVRHYLKRTDPFVFKSIVGVDYDTLVRQQKEDIAMMNKLQNQKFTPKEETLSPNNEEQKIEKGTHKTHYVTEVQNNENTLNNNPYQGDSTSNLNTYKRRAKSCYKQNNFKPYIIKKDFRDTYGYDKITSFKSNGEKYTYTINTLKKNNFSNSKECKPKRRYDGFRAAEPPLIQRTKENSAPFDNFNNQIGQTLNCLNRNNGIQRAMNEEEMKTNLYNQTSNEFLKRNHLPDVVKIANSRQVIRNQKIGLSKEMGEKYNPYSLIAPSKNRTGRNYIGDLFKH